MSDEYLLNCLSICESFSTELDLCFTETGRGEAVELMEKRAREGVEGMESNPEMERRLVFEHIRGVCEAARGAVEEAVRKEQDFRALGESIFGRAAEDARLPKGALHFGAGMERSGVFREYVLCCLRALQAVAAEA